MAGTEFKADTSQFKELAKLYKMTPRFPIRYADESISGDDRQIQRDGTEQEGETF